MSWRGCLVVYVLAWVPGGSASGEGHANAETNKAMKALNELVHSHRCRTQQRQDPTHRLGGTTGISKASVSTGGTPQSASGGTPCAQRVAADPVPNATALRGGRVRVAPAPPLAKVLAAALQQNTTLQSLSPN